MTAIAMQSSGGWIERIPRRLFNLVLQVFILSTLFDPADRLLGLKVPLYILCWAIGILVCWTEPGRVRIPFGLLGYCLVMIAIPLLSIALYVLTDGADPYEGLAMFKAYVFISMALLLYVTRTNLLRPLSIGLTLVALSVVGVGIVVLSVPSLFLPIYAFGNQFGMFAIDNRNYGSGVVLFQMYFVTSPMLAISAAYFFNRTAVDSERRGWYALLAAVNLGAMVFAGSRNNLMAAVLLPLAMLILLSRRKAFAIVLVAVVSATAAYLAVDFLAALLNPSETSNRTKLALLADYGRILSEPSNLFFGRGLGVYEHWTDRNYYYVTELTYLEVFRNFGLILGSVMMFLVVYPVIYAFFLRRSYPEKGIIVGYVTYLIMCISNPNFFSSMGMMILSVILANIWMYEAARKHNGGSIAGASTPAMLQ